MSVSDRYTGKDLYLSVGGVSIAGSFRTFEVTYTQDTVESQAGAEGAKYHIATLLSASWSLTFLDEGTAGTAVRTALRQGQVGTLLYGPQGTASGKPKGGFYSIVTECRESYPYDGVVEYSVTGNSSGSILFNIGTATW